MYESIVRISNEKKNRLENILIANINLLRNTRELFQKQINWYTTGKDLLLLF